MRQKNSEGNWHQNVSDDDHDDDVTYPESSVMTSSCECV